MCQRKNPSTFLVQPMNEFTSLDDSGHFRGLLDAPQHIDSFSLIIIVCSFACFLASQGVIVATERCFEASALSCSRAFRSRVAAQ